MVALLLAVGIIASGCGSGRQFLTQMHRDDRQQLQAFIQQARTQRAMARQRLVGPARRTAYVRIATASNARIDSLLNTRYNATPFHRRRHAVEQQLGFGSRHAVVPNPNALEELESF